MTDGTRPEAAPEGHAIYTRGQLVAEDRRDSRVGRVDHAWDEAPPVLYRLYGPGQNRPWFAWERDLRPATEAEVAAYEAALRREDITTGVRDTSRNG